MGAEKIARAGYRVRRKQGQKLPLFLSTSKTKVKIGAFRSRPCVTMRVCKEPVQSLFHKVFLGLLYLPDEDTGKARWGGKQADQRGSW